MNIIIGIVVVIYFVIGLIVLFRKEWSEWGDFLVNPIAWMAMLVMTPLWPLWYIDYLIKKRKHGNSYEFDNFDGDEEGSDFGFRRNDTQE